MITDRIDAITRIDEKHRGEIIPAPKSVKIELTGRCNFACAFCARSQNLRDVGDIDKDLLYKILHDMRNNGVEEIGMFYLGESFMVKWLPDAIRMAKSIGFPYVFLTTNGSLATSDKVRECMRAGLDSLKFSFNYSDGTQLNEIARVKPKIFDNIIENIKESYRIRNEGDYDCGLYASYIEYDGEQAEKMREAVEEIKPYVDQVYGLPLYNQASLVDKEGWAFTAGNRGRLGALRDPIPCWSVFTEGHVTWDGKLSACCFDHNDNLTMGDLNTQSFMDAWNSEKFQKLRHAHLNRNIENTPCAKCVAYA